jgi:hypothetical protein
MHQKKPHFNNPKITYGISFLGKPPKVNYTLESISKSITKAYNLIFKNIHLPKAGTT